MTRAITVLFLWIALAMSAAGPVAAQSDEATSARLDALFGAHEPYRAFLAALKDAASKDEFARRYDELFTPAVVAAVEQQTYATLFANAEGVMIGNGEVWFSGICADATCSDASVKIIAVNQPDGPESDRRSGADP